MPQRSTNVLFELLIGAEGDRTYVVKAEAGEEIRPGQWAWSPTALPPFIGFNGPATDVLTEGELMWEETSDATRRLFMTIATADPKHYRVTVSKPNVSFVERPTATLNVTSSGGEVTEGNVGLSLTVHNNTNDQQSVGIVVDCSVTKGAADPIRSGRFYGVFTVPETPSSNHNISVGSFCQGIDLEQNDVIAFTARIQGDGHIQQSASQSGTVTWPNDTTSTLFDHHSTHIMGGLQVRVVESGYVGTCTASFTLTMKDLSDSSGASDYQGISITEHCAEVVDTAANTSKWYQAPNRYYRTEKVAETAMVAEATDCQIMETDSSSIASTAIDPNTNDDNCTIGDQSYGEEYVPMTPHAYDNGYIFKSGSDPIANDDATRSPRVEYYSGDPATDRFLITSARPPVDGETLHKVGRTTGWTSGMIDRANALRVDPLDPTCPGSPVGVADNENFEEKNVYIECLSYTSMATVAGDSGSPVFARLGSSDYVHLVGVLYGQLADKGVFVPIDRIYAESLRQGFDWDPWWLRPIPAPSDLDQERNSSGGVDTITIKTTFLKQRFSPSLYYRAKLLKEGSTAGELITHRTCYVTVSTRTDLGYEGHEPKNRTAGYTNCAVSEEYVMIPGRTGQHSGVVVSFSGLDASLTETFRVKLEACKETASGGENCGGFGSDGLQKEELGGASSQQAPLDLPPAPGLLTATPTGKTAIDLSWIPVPGADRYRIERSVSGTDSWSLVDEHATSTPYTVADLTCSTTYYFRVSTHGDGMVLAADWSSSVAIVRTQTEVCNRAPVFGQTRYDFSVPEDVLVSHAVGTVSATDPDEGDTLTYAIAEGNDDGRFTVVTSATSTQVMVATELDYETTPEYTLTVEASDGNGGIATAMVSIVVTEVAGAPPPAPQNLTATSTSGSVTLQWDAPEDSTIAGYQILRKKLGERDLRVHVEDTGSAETTYVDTPNLDPEITYVYRVKAINDAGVGKWSNFVRVVAMGTGS